MPQIEINVSCNNCDFVRTYWNDMPNQDDILEDFYHCANDDCFQEICVECSQNCTNCNHEFCEECYNHDRELCNECSENIIECPKCLTENDYNNDQCSNCGYKPEVITK